MGDWRRGGLLALAAGLTASMPLVAQESYTLGGPEVAIYNLAGRAEIVRGSGSEVRVTLVRGGRDADELQVESGRVEGRETLRVLYPDDNIIYDASATTGPSTTRAAAVAACAYARPDAVSRPGPTCGLRCRRGGTWPCSWPWGTSRRTGWREASMWTWAPRRCRWTTTPAR